MPTPRKRAKPTDIRAARRRRASRVATSGRSVFQDILREAKGLYDIEDPLQAETYASALLTMLHIDGVDVDQPQRTMGEDLIDYLADRRTPDALAIVHALAAVAPEELAAVARRAVARLRATGLEDPPFASRLGPYRFVRGWAAADEYGDQDSIALTFADPTGAEHTVSVLVDHNFLGLIREAFLTYEEAELRRRFESEPGLIVSDVDAQGAADRVGQGLAMLVTYVDPPVSEDVDLLAALIATRLRVLPEWRARTGPEMSPEARERMVDVFRVSPEAKGLGEAGWLARWLVDYRLDHTDGDPLRWSPIAVEICLLDWFPRTATLAPEEIDALPEVLRRFVRYAGRHKRLGRDAIAETLDAVDGFEPEYRAAMADPGSAGPAKALATAMLADGVDLADEEAVAGWIEAFNERSLEERIAVVGPPTGQGGLRVSAGPVSRSTVRRSGLH